MTNLDTFETYSAAFESYLEDGADWIGSAELPIVHHVRQLCIQLDSSGLDKAALASAYLQAVERLNRRRPSSSSPPAPGDLPGQGSIFDELTD